MIFKITFINLIFFNQLGALRQTDAFLLVRRLALQRCYYPNHFAKQPARSTVLTLKMCKLNVQEAVERRHFDNSN